eukprot:10385-Heterococcus_DN1.PRE.2
MKCSSYLTACLALLAATAHAEHSTGSSGDGALRSASSPSGHHHDERAPCPSESATDRSSTPVDNDTSGDTAPAPAPASGSDGNEAPSGSGGNEAPSGNGNPAPAPAPAPASGGGAPASGKGVSAEDQKTILDLHTKARADVQPPASNMAAMTWSAEVAAAAQTYADTCPEDHDPTRTYGENLSWGSPSQTAEAAIQGWLDEKADFTYPSSTLNHYTQVIWATTTAVGCGTAQCPSLSIGAGQLFHAMAGASRTLLSAVLCHVMSYNAASACSSTVWVCKYSPPGNMSGEPPYKTARRLTGATDAAAATAQGDNSKAKVEGVRKHKLANWI